jgi:hypothetical protein
MCSQGGRFTTATAREFGEQSVSKRAPDFGKGVPVEEKKGSFAMK